MNYELKQGQKEFSGVLVEFERVKGTAKKTGKDFDFVKFNIDLSLTDRDGNKYTKLQEFLCEPSILAGQTFEKYKEVILIFEIVNPITAPKLVQIIKI